ncbi:transposase [Mesorhizobium sp. M0435]|uniref:IS4/Tn5 family transposase DNA-binding protein n=1 Tax=Mesorhizobium sp. M0435 TaxID=2956944 RepID=UPI00333B45C4
MEGTEGTADAWFDRKLSECRFADERLGKRLRQLVECMEGAMRASIPLACQDWTNTKAAYRFFSNDRVSEEKFSPFCRDERVRS